MGSGLLCFPARVRDPINGDGPKVVKVLYKGVLATYKFDFKAETGPGTRELHRRRGANKYETVHFM